MSQAQGLAVDRHRPPPAGSGRTGAPVPVGQPGADSNGERVDVQAGKGPADGGLGGTAKWPGTSRRAPSAARTG